MGQIDNAHDAKYQRQTRSHQKQQQAVLQRVQALDEKSGEVHTNTGLCLTQRGVRAQALGLIAPKPYILQPRPGSANLALAMPTTLFSFSLSLVWRR